MKTVLIPTSNNVYIEYEVASLSQRFFALFFDLVFVIVAFTISYNLLLVIFSFNKEIIESLFYIICAPWFLFYHLITEMLFNGRSLGKVVLGLKVVSLSGTNVTAQQYVMRWMFRVLEIGITIFSLAALMVSSTDKGQRLGDLNANTCVINTKPKNTLRANDIVKIHEKSINYEVKYPEVASWDEKDMLLIKNATERYVKYKNKAHENIVRELFDKCCDRLEIIDKPKNKTAFLRKLIKDYIALTR